MQRSDLIAGVSIAGLMLPEAVAYAGIAGLPPGRAIVAGVAGCLAYAAVGRSRFAILSPTSSSAAILAASLATMQVMPTTRGAVATAAVAIAGLLFVVAAALRLGALTGFVARPVLRGFAFGIALTIIARQLPAITGVGVTAPNIVLLALRVAGAFAHWNWLSVATGIGALMLLLVLRRRSGVPAAFVVLALGIAVSAMFGFRLHGVAIVGDVDIELSVPTWPDLSFGQLSRLVQLVLPLALILFAESWGTMRTLALRHGDAINSDRELAAIGVANIASAMVQGMPVGAGFSAGSASETAGASSRWAGIAAALSLMLLAWFARPWIALLPDSVLAAIVIGALTHALAPAPLLRLWRIDRDQIVALAAALGVIALGVLDGMLFAIALSIVALLRRLASPQLVTLGRLAGGHDYVDLARHSDAVIVPGLAIWRPAEPLLFANAERVLGVIEDRLRATTDVHAAVLSLEESFDLDSTALDCLIEFDQKLKALGFTLQLARVHDTVRDLLQRAGASDLVTRSSYSVDDAVTTVGGSL